MTHGWPGSVFELLKVIGPLTDPAAHGGDAEDAFHLVIPSLPGYGFSGRPPSPAGTPTASRRAWDELMTRLGYTRYVAQGGDWGAGRHRGDGTAGTGRACAASTSTWPRRYRPTWKRPWPAPRPCRP